MAHGHNYEDGITTAIFPRGKNHPRLNVEPWEGVCVCVCGGGGGGGGDVWKGAENKDCSTLKSQEAPSFAEPNCFLYQLFRKTDYTIDGLLLFKA